MPSIKFEWRTGKCFSNSVCSSSEWDIFLKRWSWVIAKIPQVCPRNGGRILGAVEPSLRCWGTVASSGTLSARPWIPYLTTNLWRSSEFLMEIINLKLWLYNIPCPLALSCGPTMTKQLRYDGDRTAPWAIPRFSWEGFPCLSRENGADTAPSMPHLDLFFSAEHPFHCFSPPSSFHTFQFLEEEISTRRKHDKWKKTNTGADLQRKCGVHFCSESAPVFAFFFHLSFVFLVLFFPLCIFTNDPNLPLWSASFPFHLALNDVDEIPLDSLALASEQFGRLR